MFWENLLANLPLYLTVLVAFIAVVIVTWLYARTRFLAEIAKYQTQLATIQLERNDLLFSLEDDCKAKNERVRLILKDLKTQLHLKNAEIVLARRNELSNVFMLDYCPAMHKYARLALEMYEQDPQKHRLFIENQIFPFLQLAGDLLVVLNQDSVLQLIGMPPVHFNYLDFDFAFDFIRAKKRFSDFGLNAAMKKHLQRLGFEKDIKIHN